MSFRAAIADRGRRLVLILPVLKPVASINIIVLLLVVIIIKIVSNAVRALPLAVWDFEKPRTKAVCMITESLQ